MIFLFIVVFIIGLIIFYINAEKEKKKKKVLLEKSKKNNIVKNKIINDISDENNLINDEKIKVIDNDKKINMDLDEITKEFIEVKKEPVEIKKEPVEIKKESVEIKECNKGFTGEDCSEYVWKENYNKLILTDTLSINSFGNYSDAFNFCDNSEYCGGIVKEDNIYNLYGNEYKLVSNSGTISWLKPVSNIDTGDKYTVRDINEENIATSLLIGTFENILNIGLDSGIRTSFSKIMKGISKNPRLQAKIYKNIVDEMGAKKLRIC